MKVKSKNLRYCVAVLTGTVLLLAWSSRGLAADSGTNIQLYVPAQTTETGTITDNNTDRADQDQNEVTAKVQEQKTARRQTASVKTDDKTEQLLIWKMLLIIGGVIAGRCIWRSVRKNHEE